MKINRKFKPESAVSKDKLRVSLNHVKAFKRKLCACDGHIAAFIPYELNNDGLQEEKITGLIPAETFKESRKLNKKLDRDNMIIEHNGKLIVKEYGGTKQSEFGYCDEPYPDVVRVLPTRKPAVFEISLNVDNLKRLSDALGTETLTLQFTGQTSAVIVKPTNAMNDDGQWGIIMPCRI